MLRDNRSLSLAAPKHLDAPERDLWERLIRSFALDDPGSRELLLQACEARMRARLAREIILKEGCTYRDDRKNLKAHPAVAMERSAQASFLSAMRLLKLDLAGTEKRDD
jgi:P27 family predicted phage terminase small subunit